MSDGIPQTLVENELPHDSVASPSRGELTRQSVPVISSTLSTHAAGSASQAAVESSPALASTLDDSLQGESKPTPSLDVQWNANDADHSNIADESRRQLGLSRGDQFFLGCFVFIAMVLMGLHAWKSSRWSLQSIELSHHPEREWDYHLDINSATWVEWMQLEGIGERLALRIVEDRKKNGPYRTIHDLTRVSGIGPKTIERLSPHLRCIVPREENVISDRSHAEHADAASSSYP